MRGNESEKSAIFQSKKFMNEICSLSELLKIVQLLCVCVCVDTCDMGLVEKKSEKEVSKQTACL